MRDDSIQRNIQFPLLLYDEISKIAKTRGVSFASVVREACIQYLYTTTPGLCSHCHTQNPPDSQYCQQCGEPLTAEAAESIQTELKSLRHTVSILDQRLKIIERMEQHLKEQGDKI